MPKIKINIDPDVFLPCYTHLLETTADLNFLWGGRDSGKSDFIASKLILDCLTSKYFRCILIKKTFESIKDAQWQTIKDICERWGISHLFNFKQSPLEIICANGNKFIARGCDNPQKIKSISNPSHAWYEEGNQLTESDYVVATTTLRSSKGKVQEWFSFNPECEEDYEDFWLYKNYFKQRYEKNELTFTDTVNVPLPDGSAYKRVYTSTHTTYHDNLEYCSPDRIAKHEGLKTTNPYYYKVYAQGLWGKRQAGGEFLKCWDTATHTGDFPYNPNLAIYLMFDENVNPYFPVGIFQIADNQKDIYMIDCIAAKHPNNKHTWMGREITRKFLEWSHTGKVYVGGDPTSDKEDVKQEEGHDLFQLMMIELKQFKPQRKVAAGPPSVTMSGNFFNSILDGQADGLTFHVDSKCRVAILDYENTKEDKNGKVDKKTVVDPTTKVSYQPYGHFVDLTRYFLCHIFHREYYNYQMGTKHHQMSGGRVRPKNSW